jgi:hypothetical protein
MKSVSKSFAIRGSIAAKIAFALAVTLFLISPIGSGAAWSQSSQSINDLFVQIGNLIPGFGGLYVDPDQDTLYVYMVGGQQGDLSQLDQVLTNVLGADRPPESNLVVLPAQYSFLQLKGWQDYSDPILLTMPDVSSTGIHHTTNKLQIGVATQDAGAQVQQQLAALGVPSDAVETVLEQPAEEQSNKECTSVQSQCRPAVGGIQIHADKDPANVFSTLSFNATRAGIVGFVTCSHCANVAFKNTGTVYDQNLAGKAKIGTEISNPPLVAALGGAFVCPKGDTCRLSDSSFAEYVGGLPIKVGFLARPALNQTAWNGNDYFRIVAYSKSIEGEYVAKVGRTTGLTEGKVTGVCRNRKRQANQSLICQNTADYDSGGGDSGSPVFLCSTTKKRCSEAKEFDVHLLGIHSAGEPHGVAGDRYYSDITLVMDATTELGPLTKFCDPAIKNPTCS